MVADKLQRQEEERIQCSPTSQIDNLGEEEMDTSISHHKRKVQIQIQILMFSGDIINLRHWEAETGKKLN